MNLFLANGIISFCTFLVGCEKKEPGKFGLHDHPLFLEHSSQVAQDLRSIEPSLVSIFAEPATDPFREQHLDFLQKNHYPLYSYAIKHPRCSSRDCMLVAALDKKFGLHSGMSLIFIGGYEWEFQKIFCEVFDIQKITVIDLEPCLDVAKQMLIGDQIRWITPNEVDETIEGDLILSSTSFSHLNETWQNHFLKTIFHQAKGGGLFYQAIPRHYGVKPWKKERFLQQLRQKFSIDISNSNSLTEDIQSLILFSA